jgi:hypothetical protein
MDNFIDQTSLSKHERFTFMLFERLQALEDTVVSLYNESTTFELHGVIQLKPSHSMNSIKRESYDDYVEAFGASLILADIDVIQVVIESDKYNTNPTQSDPSEILSNIMGLKNNKNMYMTIRMETKHSIKTMSELLSKTMCNIRNQHEFKLSGGWSVIPLLDRANVRTSFVWNEKSSVKKTEPETSTFEPNERNERVHLDDVPNINGLLNLDLPDAIRCGLFMTSAFMGAMGINQ